MLIESAVEHVLESGKPLPPADELTLSPRQLLTESPPRSSSKALSPSGSSPSALPAFDFLEALAKVCARGFALRVVFSQFVCGAGVAEIGAEAGGVPHRVGAQRARSSRVCRPGRRRCWGRRRC